jgi:hypothetical protein
MNIKMIIVLALIVATSACARVPAVPTTGCIPAAEYRSMDSFDKDRFEATFYSESNVLACRIQAEQSK